VPRHHETLPDATKAKLLRLGSPVTGSRSTTAGEIFQAANPPNQSGGKRHRVAAGRRTCARYLFHTFNPSFAQISSRTGTPSRSLRFRCSSAD
jgi:hypothetical protein